MPPKKPSKPFKASKASKTSKVSKASKLPEPSKPSKPSEPSKPSDLQAVSSYNLCKVHIPYVCEDGTSMYQPRSAPKKAAILRKSLLMLAKQKQQ